MITLFTVTFLEMDCMIESLFNNLPQETKHDVCILKNTVGVDFNFSKKNGFTFSYNIFRNFLNMDLDNEQKTLFVKRFLTIEPWTLNNILNVLSSEYFKNSHLLDVIRVTNKHLELNRYDDTKTILEKINSFCHIISEGCYITDSIITLQLCEDLDNMCLLKPIFINNRFYNDLYDYERCKKVIEHAINKDCVSFLIDKVRNIINENSMSMCSICD